MSPPTAAFKAHLNHNDSAVSISILLATSCICNPWLEATKIAAAVGFVEDPMTTQVSEEEEVGATSGAAEAVAEGGEEVDQSTLMSLTCPYSNGQVVGVTFQLPFHDLLKSMLYLQTSHRILPLLAGTDHPGDEVGEEGSFRRPSMYTPAPEEALTLLAEEDNLTIKSLTLTRPPGDVVVTSVPSSMQELRCPSCCTKIGHI